ncbi:OadG family protein [Algicola sagamiensis]|uniref:OadG family protein n=1 Tax=Algicola sagamiensis TaxID=163869 RepID=UPI00037F256C|nr:OadG family protein [Algicola sagamiensis]
MAVTEQLLEALNLMLTGMGFVFVFLILLIICIKALTKFAVSIDTRRDDPVPSITPAPHAVKAQQHGTPPEVVAAISAAIHQYRKQHK